MSSKTLDDVQTVIIMILTDIIISCDQCLSYFFDFFVWSTGLPNRSTCFLSRLDRLTAELAGD